MLTHYFNFRTHKNSSSTILSDPTSDPRNSDNDGSWSFGTPTKGPSLNSEPEEQEYLHDSVILSS